MAFNVNSLSTYVEEQKSDLIVKSVFGAPTIDNVTIQTGLKGKTSLNLLDVDVTLQDGSTCGFNAQGDDTISQRFINPMHYKVDKEWCDKTLLGKYAQYEVVTAASGKKLPFEAVIMGSLADGVKDEIEKVIWQGHSSASSATAPGAGLTSILIADAASTTVTGYTGSNAWAKAQETYKKLPANVLSKEDLTGYASPEYFESLVLELINANLYHFNPSDETGVITMPGTGVKIVRTPGLAGNSDDVALVFARKSNVFYGVDEATDSTDIDAWYSKDSRAFRATVEFVAGVQVAYPNEVAVLTA